jgi:hypothetical protein
MLRLICHITFCFSIIDSLVILYNALDRSELQYAPDARNSTIPTDSSKLGTISLRSFSLMLEQISYRHVWYDECFNTPVQVANPWCLLIAVFQKKISSLSILDNVGLRVPAALTIPSLLLMCTVAQRLPVRLMCSCGKCCLQMYWYFQHTVQMTLLNLLITGVTCTETVVKGK